MQIRIFLLFITLIFSACSGLTGSQGIEEGSPTIQGPAPGSGGGNLLPQSSIPPPSLTKGHVVTYAPDANQNTPVMGDAGSVDTTGMSDTDEDGFADVFSVQVVADEATPVSCPLKMDGSFECSIPSTTVASQLSMAVTDGVQKSEAITETPNQHLLWVKNTPSDVVAGGSALELATLGLTDSDVAFTLAGNNIVPIVNVDGTFMVAGNAENNYSIGTAQNQLAYDPTNSYLANRTSAGIPYTSFLPEYLGDPLTDVLSDVGTVTVPEAEDYTALKFSGDGKLRFGIKSVIAAQNHGRIFSLTPMDYSTNIDFFKIGDVDAQGMPLTHNQTLAFDMDDGSFKIALALFEDTSNNIRLRANYLLDPSRGRFGGSSPLTSGDNFIFTANDFGDLLVYKYQTSTQVGRALLLDKTHAKIWVITYSYDALTPANSRVTSTFASATNGISIGNNPKDIVLNTDKTRAYIVCSDNKIYVLDLFKASGVARDPATVRVGTINLTDFIDKPIELKPSTISYQKDISGNEYLLVGSEGLKGMLAIDLETVTILAL
ncbi:hypothetical protein K1X76_12510 [bacterium]|nr:hypothetical protein [bacterium]